MTTPVNRKILRGKSVLVVYLASQITRLSDVERKIYKLQFIKNLRVLTEDSSKAFGVAGIVHGVL